MPTSPVESVFDAWRDATNHPRAALDPKRRKLIAGALKAYPIEDIIDACRGITDSAFHMGQNDNGTRYDGLHVILRDAEHIEKFRDLHRDGPMMPVSPAMATLAKIVASGETWGVST